MEDGYGGENVIGVGEWKEEVAVKGSGTPWSTGTKLKARDNLIPRSPTSHLCILLTRDPSP